MKSERLHKRAPLGQNVLYIHDDYVFKAKCINISQGGVLLDQLPIVPNKKKVPFIVSVPKLPLFTDLEEKKQFGINSISMKCDFLRLNMNIVRTFEGQSEVDKVFVSRVGLEVCNLNGSEKSIIESYVVRMEQNIAYILGLFENISDNKNPLDSELGEMIKQISVMINYDKDLELNSLRNKLLHDYQGLKT